MQARENSIDNLWSFNRTDVGLNEATKKRLVELKPFTKSVTLYFTVEPSNVPAKNIHRGKIRGEKNQRFKDPLVLALLLPFSCF